MIMRLAIHLGGSCARGALSGEGSSVVALSITISPALDMWYSSRSG